MCGNHELLVSVPRQCLHRDEERELALRRQGRFRFIQDVQPVRRESVLRQREKRLSVRLLVQGSAAVGGDDRRPPRFAIEALDLRRHVEVALRAQEVPCLRSPDATHQSDYRVQLGLRSARREVEVLASTLGVEARRDGDRFRDGRFPASILAYQERHLRMQLERVERADGGDVEGVSVEVLHLLAHEGHRPHKRVELWLPASAQFPGPDPFAPSKLRVSLPPSTSSSCSASSRWRSSTTNSAPSSAAASAALRTISRMNAALTRSVRSTIVSKSLTSNRRPCRYSSNKRRRQ